MGRYDGEDYADESGYASSALQDAVRRGAPPGQGYPGYSEEKKYPICARCTHRHHKAEDCVGEVGEQDRLVRNRLAHEAYELRKIEDAKVLLESAGYSVERPDH